jgi:hypothetical protein
MPSGVSNPPGTILPASDRRPRASALASPPVETPTPLRVWSVPGRTSGAARVELWPDRIEWAFSVDRPCAVTESFSDALTRCRPLLPLPLEQELCVAVASLAAPASLSPPAAAAQAFFRAFDPGALPPMDVPFRSVFGEHRLLVDGPGARAVQAFGAASERRIDRFFFAGPGELPPLPLPLRAAVREAIARAAGLDPSAGFPLLDHGRIHLERERDDETLRLELHHAAHLVPSVDPETMEPDLAVTSWGIEEFLLDLDRCLPATFAADRDAIAAHLAAARIDAVPAGPARGSSAG